MQQQILSNHYPDAKSPTDVARLIPGYRLYARTEGKSDKTIAIEVTVSMAQEIGESVGHSTKTVLLTSASGRALKYHGELAGQQWPTTFRLYGYRLAGLPQLTAEERFNEHYLEYSPEYFIVTAFRDFEEQADLKSFLTSKFPIAAQSDDYLIFDLRETLDPEKQLEKE